MNAPALKQLDALIWKEWHEVRIYLWIALGVFIGLPLVQGLEAMTHAGMHFFLSTAPWVIVFGGVLAIFVAVGATCRDFRGRLDDFWRSRPVGTTRWLMVKYVVGLVVVLAACLLPLVCQWAVDREGASVMVLFPALPFFLAAVYSVGFLSGCLIRRAAHAAMMATAAMLLIYFVPVIVPPLAFLNVEPFLDGPSGHWSGKFADLITDALVHFDGGMLVLTIALVVFALVAAERGWHIESSRKLLYSSIGTAFLALFASAAFQLGTNLPLLQVIDMPWNKTYGLGVTLLSDGNRGIVVAERWARTRNDGFTRAYDISHFNLTASGIQMAGDLIAQDMPQANSMWIYNWGGTRTIAHAPSDWSTAYAMEEQIVQTMQDDSHRPPFELHVADMKSGSERIVLTFTDLYPSDPLDPNSHFSWHWPLLYAWKDRLYVIGERMATLDISDPQNPKLLSKSIYEGGGMENPFVLASVDGATPRQMHATLPDIPELPAAQRLDLAMKIESSSYQVFDGEVACFQDRARGSGAIAEYRLKNLTQWKATFAFAGVYTPTLLDQFLRSQGYSWQMDLSDGLLYLHDGANSQYLNPRIAVFETRGDRGLRLVGHFAVPSISDFRPLADGRALVAGAGKLYLVGPPARDTAKD